MAEVFVIDGLSDDGTREHLTILAKKYQRLTILENPRKKVTSALNIGIARARGKVIVRLDAHALYANDYLEQCLAVMEQSGAANVGGHMRALPSRKSIISGAIALAHFNMFGLGGGRFHNERFEGFVETVWLGCYKKEVVDAIGYFRENLPRSEDIDFNSRLRNQGHRIFLSSKIKAYYFCRPTLRSLWRQRFLDGNGIIQTFFVNPGAVRLRHCAPLFAGVLSLSIISWALTAYIASMPGQLKMSSLAIAAGAILWLCGALYYSIRSAGDLGTINRYLEQCSLRDRRVGKNAIFVLPIVFAVLHSSYAVGSLHGIIVEPVKFLREWIIKFRKGEETV